jgi:hypothetical protein
VQESKAIVKRKVLLDLKTRQAYDRAVFCFSSPQGVEPKNNCKLNLVLSGINERPFAVVSNSTVKVMCASVRKEVPNEFPLSFPSSSIRDLS